MAGNVLEFSDQNFDSEVVGSDTLTVVDFWAEWCGPCKMIAPIMEALAEEYTGKVRVGKLNIDENPSTPTKFGIRGIPTLLFFKEGKVANQIVGFQPQASIQKAVDEVLTG